MTGQACNISISRCPSPLRDSRPARLKRDLQDLFLACLCACVVTGLVPAIGVASSADGRIEIELASGFDMQVLQFPADGERLLIWLPSKYGIRDGNGPFAQTIQQQGIDYWLVDLHASYLAPTGRGAYSEFEPRHIKELLDHAVTQGWRRIVLGGESRGARLAMRAARQWQIENSGDPRLEGLLLFHPFLLDGYIEIGEPARFRPIARATNLPVYIFQPELNTKALHSRQLLEQLELGGARVYFHTLDGVRGGFHLRDPETLNPREVLERARIGQHIRTAMALLAGLPTPAEAAAWPTEQSSASGAGDESAGVLVPLTRQDRPPLRLPDLQGRVVDLEDLDGEVVLVNFWATWCGPCIREIASMIRLVEHFEGRPFRILAINIGESPEQVATFFGHLGYEPNFDLLFDPDGEAARAWRIHAVPSSYLLDGRQKVRYGYRGALRWDKPGVIGIIEGLLAQGVAQQASEAATDGR